MAVEARRGRPLTTPLTKDHWRRVCLYVPKPPPKRAVK